jgi:hypothetical protein
MGDQVAGYVQREDVSAMARTGLAGAVLDAVTHIAYRQAVRDRDLGWLSDLNDVLLSPRVEAQHWQTMQSGASALPWDDPARLADAVEDLRLRCGSPQVTMLLADLCAERGHPTIAAAMRQRVEHLFTNLRHLADHAGIGRANRRWLDFHAVRVLGGNPATNAVALAAMTRYLANLREEDEWDSASLEFARACLVARRREEAIDWLVRSFSAMQQATDPRYLEAGQVYATSKSYRTPLLARIADQGALTPAERQRLIGAARADQVEPGFAELLGVAHATLKGAAVQPGANDF